MPLQNLDMEHETLGNFLRGTRAEQGLDLDAVAEQTKISLKNLQAIEDDNFSALPAEAFTRGFYALYARALSLDSDHILQRYRRERPAGTPDNIQKNGLENQPYDVGIMAERPSSLPLSTFGLAMFCFLVVGGFFCWYFSWNPATYLSYKLRSLQDPSPHVEQTTKSYNVPIVPDPLSYFKSTSREKSSSYDIFTLPTPTSATAAVSKPQQVEESPLIEPHRPAP
ncbi:MAG: helix-turn-helix domain-containing protein [Desulforhopalus sp.]